MRFFVSDENPVTAIPNFVKKGGTHYVPFSEWVYMYVPHGFSKAGYPKWIFSLKTRVSGTNFCQISVFRSAFIKSEGIAPKNANFFYDQWKTEGIGTDIRC